MSRLLPEERECSFKWRVFKLNRLNEHLWAAGFRLPTCRDGEAQVVKWLLTPVSEYLREGSPVLDYTQEDDEFIKSKHGDIEHVESMEPLEATRTL